MIEKISVVLMNESGDFVPIKNDKLNVELKIDTVIADLFSQICFANNSITDAEIQQAEKFTFALNLNNYLKEMKETYASHPTAN